MSGEDLVLLEGVSVAGLLHGLDDRLVDAEGDGDTEQGEQQVGHHTDDAEGCQGQKQQHRQTEHHTRLLGVSPVDQILNCREVEGRRGLDRYWSAHSWPTMEHHSNIKSVL